LGFLLGNLGKRRRRRFWCCRRLGGRRCRGWPWPWTLGLGPAHQHLFARRELGENEDSIVVYDEPGQTCRGRRAAAQLVEFGRFDRLGDQPALLLEPALQGFDSHLLRPHDLGQLGLRRRRVRRFRVGGDADTCNQGCRDKKTVVDTPAESSARPGYAATP
jgi:hypothetical protein